MATFYVDKRVAVNGDGSQASPYKRINEVCSPSIGANAVIEIVDGSGPYYYGLTDFGYVSQSNIYPNHGKLGTITWNFNGNKITAARELVGDAGIIWSQSSFDPTMFYCTNVSGGNPNIGTVVSAVIDDDWNALSTSLFGQYPNSGTTRFAKKWGYGDNDELGFNTIYIKGVNPYNAQRISLSFTNTSLITPTSVSNAAVEVFNDVEIEGGGSYSVNILNGSSVKYFFNRCKFENNDLLAVRSTLGTVIEFNYCYFINSGHEAFYSNGADIIANNCFFENCHTITKLTSSTVNKTISIKNCKTKNLLAGGLQFDTASTQTLIEDHNQWHIDPHSTHGGMAIAFATAGRKWTTTAISDFPPSQDTSTQVYASPESVPEGAGATITGIHDQAVAAKDYNRDNVLFLTPNMGHIDGRKTKIISSTDFAPTGYEVRSPGKIVVTGGGNIDLSGLTDTGAIDVIATPGSTIKAFTGNGTNTNLRAVATNKAPGCSRNFK